MSEDKYIVITEKTIRQALICLNIVLWIAVLVVGLCAWALGQDNGPEIDSGFYIAVLVILCPVIVVPTVVWVAIKWWSRQ
jgi:hypothetical protein